VTDPTGLQPRGEPRHGETSGTWGSRLLRYAVATFMVCAGAGAAGEVFFPAELRGDTGGNDFAGLAFIIWACGAFVLCLVGIVAFEVIRSLRRAAR
jgi:hypothetical protein